MLTKEQRRFLDHRRVARLATADSTGRPHVVPICFALMDTTLYFTVDQKPKRPGTRPLKRIANMLENPAAAVLVDHYEEDWSRLGWVMVQGRAEIIESGEEHAHAQAELIKRYTQLASMRIDDLPVVAIRIERALSWGRLTS